MHPCTVDVGGAGLSIHAVSTGPVGPRSTHVLQKHSTPQKPNCQHPTLGQAHCHAIVEPPWWHKAAAADNAHTHPTVFTPEAPLYPMLYLK
jgi:hypothetical protein